MKEPNYDEEANHINNAAVRILRKYYPNQSIRIVPKEATEYSAAYDSAEVEPEYDDEGNAIFYHGTKQDIMANGGQLKSDPAYLSAVPGYSAGYSYDPEAWNIPKDTKSVEKPRLYKVKIPKEHAKRLFREDIDVADALSDVGDVAPIDAVMGTGPIKQAIARALENKVQYVMEEPDIPHTLEEMPESDMAQEYIKSREWLDPDSDEHSAIVKNILKRRGFKHEPRSIMKHIIAEAIARTQGPGNA